MFYTKCIKIIYLASIFTLVTGTSAFADTKNIGFCTQESGEIIKIELKSNDYYQPFLVIDGTTLPIIRTEYNFTYGNVGSHSMGVHHFDFDFPNYEFAGLSFDEVNKEGIYFSYYNDEEYRESQCFFEDIVEVLKGLR